MDEYPVLVDGLAAALGTESGFTVVVRATTGADLLRHLRARSCDVVVAEPWVRSNDGLEALRHILASRRGVTVIAFSCMWDDARVNQLMELGARAYVAKSTPASSLPSIVRSAMAGMETRPSTIAGRVEAGLTARETEVLVLAATGLDSATIGARLFITERTVKFHLHNLYRKLGASNRTEASAIARGRGILS
ncbi:MAG: response regulator transcription factor [Actinomycetota bacterium]|nr:response regulator transcription factor [Actinomycetota bacterium]